MIIMDEIAGRTGEPRTQGIDAPWINADSPSMTAARFRIMLRGSAGQVIFSLNSIINRSGG